MGKSRGSVEKAAVVDDLPADIKALPIEKCFEELEQIVEALEQQAVSLEQSIALFERGMALSRRCSCELNRMEKRIQLIMENDQGQAVYEDFPAAELDNSVDE
jgi:exodeoxyribonuclease VII small subunit